MRDFPINVEHQIQRKKKLCRYFSRQKRDELEDGDKKLDTCVGIEAELGKDRVN